MKKQKALVRIALNSALYFVLINAALLLSSLAFHDSFPFEVSLNVITPVLCALVTFLTERSCLGRPKGKA